MKKFIYNFFGLTFFSLFFLVLVNPNLQSQTKTNTRTGIVRYKEGIVYFEDDKNFSLVIDIPNTTLRIQNGNTPVQGAYNLIILPATNDKASLQITILKNQTTEVMSKQQFEARINDEASRMLSRAVEKNVLYYDIELNGGYGKYYTLTDASLVNKTLNSDDFLYLTSYRANYSNGYFVVATLLSDDTNTMIFKRMLECLFSIVPLFSD